VGGPCEARAAAQSRALRLLECPAHVPQPHLSKARILAGRQCPKRLWLQCNEHSLATPPDAAQLAIFAMGSEVGERARALFPGGVLVPEPPHAHAVRRTRELLADARIAAIFEAAFEYRGVRIRVDVLERFADGRFGLREVKASKRLRNEHIYDLAVQHFVLTGAGVDVASTQLIHVNGDYVRGENEIDWTEFFARIDCDAEVQQRLPEVRALVATMSTVVSEADSPSVEPGPHCKRPHCCEFWDHCTGAKPKDWIYWLPRLTPKRYRQLRESGYTRIGEIPDHVSLTAIQTRVRDVVRSGRTFISDGLFDALRPFEGAFWSLDFEAMNPAIPLYAGVRAFDMIPFQWSLHHRDGRGNVEHMEFLAAGDADPRRVACESLIARLAPSSDPIAVYSGFEGRQLGILAATFGDLAVPLRAIARRLVDVLPIVSKHVYHEAFGGSFSIKNVTPALVPTFGYSGLGEVQQGSGASAAFQRIARGEVQPESIAKLRADLLAYCANDTLALIELIQALRELVSLGAAGAD